MEARRFGFDGDLPRAFKFDPTDSDLVTHYLLPRALGLQSEYDHAMIDEDPTSCPPWELMRRHGHAGSDHAFFFAQPRDPTLKARTSRTVLRGNGGGVGGTWRGQKGHVESLFLARDGGGGGGGEEEIEIKYRKFNLTYYSDGEAKKTSGWVMHEYQIVEPPLRAVLARVKITDKANKERRKQQKTDAADAHKSVRYQDQPGPSRNYYRVVGDHAAGHAAAMTSDGAGTSSSGSAPAVDQGDDGGVVMVEPAFYHSDNSYFTGDMSNHFNQGAGAGGSSYGSTSSNYRYSSGGELAT